MKLQIIQMQMEMDLIIVFTHFGTDLPCTKSMPVDEFRNESVCMDPLFDLYDSCPRPRTVSTSAFRVLNAEPNHMQLQALSHTMSAGTAQTVEIHVLDRFGNLLLDLKRPPLVDFRVSAGTLAYSGRFPQLLPFLKTPDGVPVAVSSCSKCTSIYKGIIRFEFPAPLTVTSDLQLVFTITARLPKITYFEKDLDFVFSQNSSKITIVPGSAKHINIDRQRLSNFNHFGAPLYRQPCVEVTDSKSNPVAPNLQVQAYL